MDNKIWHDSNFLLGIKLHLAKKEFAWFNCFKICGIFRIGLFQMLRCHGSDWKNMYHKQHGFYYQAILSKLMICTSKLKLQLVLQWLVKHSQLPRWWRNHWQFCLPRCTWLRCRRGRGIRRSRRSSPPAECDTPPRAGCAGSPHGSQRTPSCPAESEQNHEQYVMDTTYYSISVKSSSNGLFTLPDADSNPNGYMPYAEVFTLHGVRFRFQF